MYTHCIWSSMHLIACFLLLCAPLSVPLGQWWVYNDFDQSLSTEFLWIGEVNMFSLRVSSFSLLSLSLPVALASPPSVRPSAFNSQCIQTRQVAQSLWGWSLASSQTASSRPPALTARGASTLSPGTLSLPDWTSRGRRTPGLLHTTIAPSGSRWAKPQSVINGKTNRSVAEDNCFCLWFFSRSIWRRQSAWRASSLRGPKTSGWCSLCRCSKSPTVTMESRGVWWRRRAPAMIRSDICDYLTQYPACSSEWISPISTGENNLFFMHFPVWDFGYAAPITCLLSD